MTSKFSPETKNTKEKTIESLDKIIYWWSKFENRSEETNLDAKFIEEVKNEKERLVREYKIENTEVQTNNFVSNNKDTVVDILTGDFDDKFIGLDKFESYIAENFGYVNAPSLSKKELLWLIFKEYQQQKDRVKKSSPHEIKNIDVEDTYKKPDLWKGDQYPIHN